MLRGCKVSLRKAEESDHRRVYEWLAHSDLTPSFMGPPDFPDHPVPTWEEFCSDYSSHYFEDIDPYSGRFYIITAGNDEVGLVCHGRIDPIRKEVELGIWLASKDNAGHGYGPDALETLCSHLMLTYALQLFVVRPSARNHRAIVAYERAGFRPLVTATEPPKAQSSMGDYVDSFVMLKVGPPNFLLQPRALPGTIEKGRTAPADSQ